MIRVRDLQFAYGTGGFGLAVPSFDVAAGQKVAVVGPSGSGKTTLLNLMSGILSPDSGEISVAGTTISSLSDRDRRAFRIRTIGFVFQDFGLTEYLSARDNILHPYRITDALRLDAATRERAEFLAQSVGIADRLDSFPRTLSQGEKQRVAICRALIAEPSVILADEATGNLDPDTKEVILDVLFEQATLAQAAVVAVTHDHELLPKFGQVVDFRQFRRGGGA
ncbi:MAG TPA: ABC transporter ATP-binding protein [Devosia sp.]|nr:ABC transporter ATP-binding protein [Devosia sp.]